MIVVIESTIENYFTVIPWHSRYLEPISRPATRQTAKLIMFFELESYELTHFCINFHTNFKITFFCSNASPKFYALVGFRLLDNLSKVFIVLFVDVTRNNSSFFVLSLKVPIEYKNPSLHFWKRLKIRVVDFLFMPDP